MRGLAHFESICTNAVNNTSEHTSLSLTETIFSGLEGQFRAVVEATEPGVIAGFEFVDPSLAPGPCGTWQIDVREGQVVSAGQRIVAVTGSAAELGVAEDYVLGKLGFASGIATRARVFRASAPEGLSIACGGWKKLPPELKPLLRAGLATAAILPRLVEGEFVYMGKNSVLMFGSVAKAIEAGRRAEHGPVAIQVKTVEEALFAAENGAGVIMVDTGEVEDLRAVNQALKDAKERDSVKLAFGGGLGLADLEPAAQAGADAVDVGRAILDAPILDLRMRVTGPA